MKKFTIQTDDINSTSMHSLEDITKQKRSRGKGRNKKKFFAMRNIIKKVKTHGLKCFTRCLISCINSLKAENLKNSLKIKTKKKIYKLFKSDICKSRNRSILDIKMQDLLAIFSNLNVDLLTQAVREDMRSVFNFVLNLTWDEFLNFLKNENRDIVHLLGNIDNTVKVTSSDVRKYYEYIYQGVDYKKRCNIDDDYVGLYMHVEGRAPSKMEDKINFIDYISNFTG
jgi:hypothetical protein